MNKIEPPLEDGSLDAGLWALSQVADQGESFSLQTIGEVCGCSHEWIRRIEQRALKKLRRQLRHSIGIIDEKAFTRRDILTVLDADDHPEARMTMKP